MKAFSNISTRAKLFFGFGLMITIVAIVSSIAYRDTDRLKASQKALFSDDMEIAVNLLALRVYINRERVVILTFLLSDQNEYGRLQKKIDAETSDVTKLIIKLEKHAASSPAFAQKFERISTAYREFSAIRDHDVLSAINSGRRNDASAAARGALLEKFDTLREVTDQAGHDQLVEAEERMREAEEIVSTAQSTLVTANLFALAIAVLLVFWLDRIIATPLKKTTLVAQRIAHGDLTVMVPASMSTDEVGQLLGALDAMVRSWKQMMQETNTGIGTLSAAASEILAGTMQISAGANETAAAVSETTTTAEEVKQTALLANQKARSVSEAAQKAVEIAETGRAAIEQGSEGMESIQQQMNSVAETIVRLSERSQAIAEIIATVSGLAEQSNLLAVNAAIEAAKAGEQGKGFAVVAQEVKELADQSRQATKQVRMILSEIEKAISAAVMVTEQGSRTVAAGVKQTAQAGNAIKLLAESVSNSALVAMQISATSQQQLAGMDQVVLAMENIKQVSAENAAGCKQSEASAQSLHDLGQKLKSMTERYKL